jgi:endonuclease/exonuclease/phosphatase family metal-dependent hydrolase
VVGSRLGGTAMAARSQLHRCGSGVGRWVLVVVLALAPVAVAVPAQAATPYRFLQFNTSGNVRYGGDPQAGVDIGNSVLSLRPHVVTINEICRNQAERLDTWLTSAGYPVQVTHYQTIPTFVTSRGFTCQYGNALVSVGEQSQQQIDHDPLPSAGLEQRAMTCADVALPLVVRACVAHLTNGTDASRSDVRTTQISVIAGEPNLRDRISRRAPLLLGGDMNVSPRGDSYNPDQLDPLYFWQGVGPFLEVEGSRTRCDPPLSPCDPTHGWRKIDYIFLDMWNWSGLSAATSSARVSDHRLLKGYASH